MLDGSNKDVPASLAGDLLEDPFEGFNFTFDLESLGTLDLQEPVDASNIQAAFEETTFKPLFRQGTEQGLAIEQAFDHRLKQVDLTDKTLSISMPIEQSCEMPGAPKNAGSPTLPKEDITKKPSLKIKLSLKRKPPVEVDQKEEEVMPRGKELDDEEDDSQVEERRRKRRETYHRAKAKREKEIAQYKERIEALEDENESIEKENQNLNACIKELEDAIKIFENAADEVDKDKDRSALEEELNQLKAQLENAEKALEALKLSKEVLNSQLKALSEEQKGLSQDNHKLREENQSLLLKTRNLETTLESQKNLSVNAAPKPSNEEDKQKILTLTKLCQQLQGMVQDLSEEKTKMASENAILKSDIIKMQMERVTSRVSGEPLLVSFAHIRETQQSVQEQTSVPQSSPKIAKI